jgi:hypothetical protein
MATMTPHIGVLRVEAYNDTGCAGAPHLSNPVSGTSNHAYLA